MKKNIQRNTKRSNIKRRNTKRSNIKRRNTKRRSTKRSNTKRRNTKRIVKGGALHRDAQAQALHDEVFKLSWYEIPINEGNHREVKRAAIDSVINSPNDKQNLIKAIEIDGTAIINAGHRQLSDDLFHKSIKQVEDDKYIKEPERLGKINLITLIKRRYEYNIMQAKKRLEISKILTNKGIDSPAQDILADPYLFEKVLENFNQRPYKIS